MNAIVNLNTNLKDLLDAAIVNIIDVSEGFCQEGNPLYTPGAEKVGPRIDRFFQQIPATNPIHQVLVTEDLHIEELYKHSDEAKTFVFHQGLGTSELRYTYDLEAIAARFRVYEMTKDQFDMWKTPLPIPAGVVLTDEEMQAYAAYYRPTPVSPVAARRGISISWHEFMQKMRNHSTKTAIVFGVADDYCVYSAIIGWLVKGFNVVFVSDLSQGIYVPEWPAAASVFEDVDSHPGVANLEELIEKRAILKQAQAEGRFRVMTSDELLRAMA